ncbi:MAG: hypothetical protein AB7S26_15045 [Sandaracinaceae bacterium]
MDAPRYVAAVDLGSHTFCLVVARADAARAGFRTVDVIKEAVSLTHGLDDATGAFSRSSMDRALAVLRRFRDRLEGWSPDDVRALGTSALRVASHAGSFLQQAERALGFPIEVIEGRVEAELAFVGAAHGGVPDRARLVIDIGGGSTELAMGRGITPELTHSEPFGHLERHKKLGGRFKEKQYRELRDATLARWREVVHGWDHGAWSEVVGTGGTIRAAQKVLLATGLSDRDVERRALLELEKRIVAIGDVEELHLDGLSVRRRDTFPGGVMVLSALMEALDADRVIAAQMGTREGILHGLLGHAREGDLRERTVLRLERRFGVEREHGERVAAMLRELAGAVRDGWPISDAALRLLEFGARLHEIGQALDHRDHEALGEALIERSSLAGFGTTEQRALAALVRLHRPGTRIKKGRLSRLRAADETLVRGVLLLRLAVLLCRNRRSQGVPPQVSASGDRLCLRLSLDTPETHPLRIADLDEEAPEWLRRKVHLDVALE